MNPTTIAAKVVVGAGRALVIACAMEGHMKRGGVSSVAILVVGMVIAACSGGGDNSGAGGGSGGDAPGLCAISKAFGDPCATCAVSMCPSTLANFDAHCGSYADCVCTGGDACASAVGAGCAPALEALGTCLQTPCASACKPELGRAGLRRRLPSRRR